jgi:hypothetical protein
MTIADYLNPEYFPLTTQPGLNIEQQMLIDSANYDELMEAEQAGALLTPEEEEISRELKAKHAAMPNVTAEMNQARIPDPPDPISPLHR